jgi:hypothetical protein
VKTSSTARLFTCALLAATGALAQDANRIVANVFGKPVTASDLKWAVGEKDTVKAAGELRQRTQQEAMHRFIAENRIAATDEDIAAYEKYDAEFRRDDRERRAKGILQTEAELKQHGLSRQHRANLERRLETLRKAAKYDAERDAIQPGTEERRRVWGPWIAGYKARKALYEKYGGRVGISKWGPDPVGATERLLREHEKRKEIEIVDVALAKEFWGWYASQPRFLAPDDQIDFTYYWLKPPSRGAP